MSGGGSALATMPILRHAVATLDRGRRRALEAVGLEDMFPDLNTTITIKSSPPKSIEELEKIALKTGKVLKRNKQLEWHNRTCMLVPHTFLYYFSEDDPNSPHGIVDLELYTDIDLLEGNVIYMHTPESVSESSLMYARDIFLCLRTSKEAKEWSEALSPNFHRFNNIVNDRDMQTSLCRNLELQAISLQQDVRALQMQQNVVTSELMQRSTVEKKIFESAVRILGPELGSNLTLLGVFELLEESIVALREELHALKLQACSADAISSAQNSRLVLEQAQEIAMMNEIIDTAHQRASDMACERQTLLDELQGLQMSLQESRAETLEARSNVTAVASECQKTKAQFQQLIAQRKVVSRELRATRSELAALRESYSQLEKKYQYLRDCTDRIDLSHEEIQQSNANEGSDMHRDIDYCDAIWTEDSKNSDNKRLKELLISKNANVSSDSDEIVRPANIESWRDEIGEEENVAISVQQTDKKSVDDSFRAVQHTGSKPVNDVFTTILESAASFGTSNQNTRKSALLKDLENTEGAITHLNPPIVAINLSNSSHNNHDDYFSGIHYCHVPEQPPPESWKRMNWRQLLDKVTNATQEGGGISGESSSMHGPYTSGLWPFKDASTNNVARRNTDFH